MTDHWRSMTRAGNLAFDERRWEYALSMYELAMIEATKHYDAFLLVDADQALASILICYFNTADTYEKMGRFELAMEQFDLCFQFLSQQLGSSTANRLVKLAVLSGYSRAKTEWLLFKSKPEWLSSQIDVPALQRINHSLELSRQFH